MGMSFTSENFEHEVLKSPVPVLVDFWAPWCVPCRRIAPLIEDLAKTYDGTIAKVGNVNIEEDGRLAEEYGVTSVPTLMVFKRGVVVERIVGVQSHRALEERLKRIIS
jgi:thioredoxin 1